MEKYNKTRNILTIIFLTATIFTMLLIMVRFFAWNYFTERLGASNSFTKAIFFDMDNLEEIDKNRKVNSLIIDWAKKYPFSQDDLNKKQSTKENQEKHFYDDYVNLVNVGKDKVARNIKAFLPGYKMFVELTNSIEQEIGWNFVNYAEYNGVIKAGDNYFIDPISKKSLSENAESVAALNKFCSEKKIDFLFAQQPSKVCKIDDKDINNSMDFSNYNMDSFLLMLENLGVDTYDHRKDIHNDNLNHHSMFYGTDHHMKAENGRWEAKHLLEYIEREYGYDTESELLKEKLFVKKTHKACHLGSQGKKIGLKTARPDDFSLLYPTFDTNIHFEVPSFEVDKTGSFEIMYDMNILDKKDYYLNNVYDVYNYGMGPLHKIENLNNQNGPKILMINDSFANIEIPFLALGVGKIDSIDLRTFTGSVKSYIEKMKPDIVIVTYSQFTVPINWESHADIFDFR